MNVLINGKIRQSRKIMRLAEEFAELEVVILQAGDFGFRPRFTTAWS